MTQTARVSPGQNRSPQNTPNGTYGRRITDFNLRATVVAAIVMLALFVGGSFWSTYVQVFTNAWNGKPASAIAGLAAATRTLIR